MKARFFKLHCKIVEFSNWIKLHDTVLYFMVLSCIDTIEVILGDWHDTGAGLSENWKSCLVDLFWHMITMRAPVGAKGRLQKKIRDYLGIFPKWQTPPPFPPFGNPSSKKKIYGLFCVLGPKEHFWFLQKCSLFVSILTYTFGNRGPPIKLP